MKKMTTLITMLLLLIGLQVQAQGTIDLSKNQVILDMEPFNRFFFNTGEVSSVDFNDANVIVNMAGNTTGQQLNKNEVAGLSFRKAVPMKVDMYDIGNKDGSTEFFKAFSKYYVIPAGEKWYSEFNMFINDSYPQIYNNMVLIVTNDYNRGDDNYREYGAIRFDNVINYTSQWGDWLSWGSIEANFINEIDEYQYSTTKDLLAGKITLTIDRTDDQLYVEINNGNCIKTYTSGIAIPNYNADEQNTNIRCFLTLEHSYIQFLSTNIEPIGGCTSKEEYKADKEPLSMTINNGLYSNIFEGEDLAQLFNYVRATVEFEGNAVKAVEGSDLKFELTPDNSVGEKTLVISYDKTYNGEQAKTPISMSVPVKVLKPVQSIEVTKQPTNNKYYLTFLPEFTEEGLYPVIELDGTGLELTATFTDGTSRPLTSDEISYATTLIPTTEVNQLPVCVFDRIFTYVDVEIIEVEPTKATVSPTILGAEDNTSTFWAAHLDNDVEVPVGKTMEFDFTQYSNCLNRWSNFVCVLRNAEKAEYLCFRGDSFGWGDSFNGTWRSHNINDFNAFTNVQNGAKVKVYVTNIGNGYVDAYILMTDTNGTVYKLSYTHIKVNSDDLWVDFTTDGSHLVFE